MRTPLASGIPDYLGRVFLPRAPIGASGTVDFMNEPWDGLDPSNTAIVTSDLLSDLTARMNRVAAVRADAVRSMRAEGMSIRRICDILGLSRWVVCELLRADQRSDGATPPNTP